MDGSRRRTRRVAAGSATGGSAEATLRPVTTSADDVLIRVRLTAGEAVVQKVSAERRSGEATNGVQRPIARPLARSSIRYGLSAQRTAAA